MCTTNSFSHLTLEERRIILTGITNGSTKTAIAQTIGKEKSTIGKEIKKHRVLAYKCKMPLECNNYRKCTFGRQCTTDCPEYNPFSCHRRDHSPDACNGCSNWSHCRFDKYQYRPEQAQAEYRRTLVDAREGVNLTTQEAKAMAAIIGPLLKQGQSPYQILASHPELGICEKTLYNYIENDVFHHVAGITVMDLRRQVSRKMSKKKSKGYKKRADHQYLQGRTYKDYKLYLENRHTNYQITDRKKTTAASKQSDPAVIFIFLISLLHNPGKIFGQGRAADQSAINIRHSENLLGIARLNAAAVLNPDFFGNSAVKFFQNLTNRSTNFLCLFIGRCPAGADRPNRFIGNHHFLRPLSRNPAQSNLCLQAH